MKFRFLPLLLVLFSLTSCFQTRNARQTTYQSTPTYQGPQKIQMALLLDTSGSMDELLEQAKSEFWFMVDELMYPYQGTQPPQLEIALYEYGNKRIGKSSDYVRQVVPLTGDLDWIASELWNLRPKGRKEYAGLAINNAVTELNWSRNPQDIKMIFIAGNESFHRGPVNPRRAIERACAEGIEVHTLFAGTYEDGYAFGWEEAGTYCGTYAALDLSMQRTYYATRYDAQICELNVYYNQTFLPYGPYGQTYYDRCIVQDNYFRNYGKAWLVNRIVVKSGPFYRNPNWDLIDALDAGVIRLEDIPANQLPRELRGMTAEQKYRTIQRYRTQRNKIRKDILDLNNNRRREIEVRLPSAPSPRSMDNRTSLNNAIVNRVRTKATPGSETPRRPVQTNRTRTEPTTTTRRPVQATPNRTQPTGRTSERVSPTVNERAPQVNRETRPSSTTTRRPVQTSPNRTQSTGRTTERVSPTINERAPEVSRATREAEARRQQQIETQRRDAELRQQQEIEARREAEEDRRQQQIDRQRREAQARQEREQEARRQQQIERQRREEQVRQEREQEARRQQQVEHQRREEQARQQRQQREQEARRQADMDRQRREAEARRQADQARKQREAEARRQSEQVRQQKRAQPAKRPSGSRSTQVIRKK